MEKGIKKEDLRCKVCYRIAGERVTHHMRFKPTREPVSGMVCATSEPSVKRLEAEKAAPTHKEHGFECLLTDNGEFHPSVRLVLSEVRDADEREAEAYNAALAQRNLRIGDMTEETRYLDGTVVQRLRCGLQFADPSAIPFRVGARDLTRKEFEDMEIPEGKSLLLCHDNGYSYCGVTPTTKEGYLNALAEICRKGFGTEMWGVCLTRTDATQRYAVDVVIGEDKGWSETSGS